MPTLDSFLAGIERKALRIALLATRAEADALDLVQDAMLKLVQHYQDREASEWPLLFHRILQNAILDWHRRNTRLKRLFWWQDQANRDDEDEHLIQQQEAAGPESDNPAHILSRAADIQRVCDLLSTLPIRQQQAFLLRAWEGYDVATTAEIMQCSGGSVKTHYFRALQRIRDALEASDATA